MPRANFLERELEDYLEGNPDSLFSHHPGYEKYMGGHVVYGRQIRCRMGVIDLLIGLHQTLFVVELKARKATFEDVGQVTRYAMALQRYTWPTFKNIVTAVEAVDYANASMAVGESIVVEPMLVAPAFARRVPESIICIQVEKTENGSFAFNPSEKTLPAQARRNSDDKIRTIMDRFGRTYAFGDALHRASWRIGLSRQGK